MNGLDWVFSAVLALAFLVIGLTKALRPEKAGRFFAWVQGMPRVLLQVIGLVEILGAVGVILPAATGFYAWLTPIAAVVLGLIALLSAGFQVLRGKREDAGVSVLLLLLAAFVAYVRWSLLP